MTQTVTASRKSELFANTSTDALVGALVILDSVESMTAEERLTYAWICTELETRIPAVRIAIEKACDDAADEEERTGVYVDFNYVAVILRALEGAK